MHLTVEQVADEALALPSEARRRIDEVRRGDVATIPADEVFAQVRQAIAR